MAMKSTQRRDIKEAWMKQSVSSKYRQRGNI